MRSELYYRAIKFAFDVQREWTLFIDGDVIPNKSFLDFLDLRYKISDDYLGYSPLITDKFWLKNRFGGFHLYRTSKLQTIYQRPIGEMDTRKSLPRCFIQLLH